MNLLKNFEIIGQLSGEPISELSFQQSDNLVIAQDPEIGLIVLSCEPMSNDQSNAQKTIEIMLDDMQFNLGPQLNGGNIKQNFVSNCLHESIENINEYLIEQNQLNPDELSSMGVSLTAVQVQNNGFSCCMHGGLACYKQSNESLELLGTKVSMAKALGVNPALNFNINEQTLNVNDIIVLAKSSFIEHIGLEFIRMTLSRFNDNLYMAIRQINARAAKNNIDQELSFILCRKTSEQKQKKGWFK